jgi:hypothetical protein
MYRVYTLDENDRDSWLQMLADEYIRLRTRRKAPHRALSTEGIEVVDIHSIAMRLKEFERRKLRASIPSYKPGNFSVLRSDFGELLNYILLEDHYQTIICKKSIEHRRMAYQIEKGIDTVGVERHVPIKLILSEVKVSDEDVSPPHVVDRNSRDCLRTQHVHHIGDRLKEGGTFDKIVDLFKDIEDENMALLLQQVEWSLFQEDWTNLHFVACSVLIRPSDTCGEKDFGSFRSSPDDYTPAYIRFLIIRVPYDIDRMIRKWDTIIAQRLENYI